MSIRLRQYFVTCLLVSLAIGTQGCASAKKSPLETEKNAFDDVRTEIRAVVADSARQASAIDLVSALQESFQVAQADLRKRKDEARLLNADYDASRADFQEVFEAMAGDLRANQARVWGIRRELADLLTADEWADIEKVRSRAIDAALKSIQSI